MLAKWFPDHVGDLIALSALLVSLWSLFKTNQFNKRQHEFAETADRLNRLLIEREAGAEVAAKKADLSANLYQSGKNNYRLKVFNRGVGTAKNVRLFNLDKSEGTLLDDREIATKFPHPILEQHQSMELIASVYWGSAKRAHIKIFWDDDAGSDHEKELTPSL